MLKLLADENFDNTIVRGLLRRNPNIERFSLSLCFEEGKNGDMKIIIESTSWGNEIECHRESFEKSKKELEREITDKIWELGISREQLELCFEIGPIEI
ncbi:hypothetical protein PN471_17605 [Aphanizomenon sp. CS-733/32]|uniref:hypothetical protein n=1 Tax=Aphanizomenon sp. CS-733/32 TaxID=3021715 RepID=UPI00232CAC4F|nr:hypothetical protein [Aphanizomenon sp. CS-733/32]MDB9310415.1 hypothetical protein [Aphanizomenon sp. CS-733/32]